MKEFMMLFWTEAKSEEEFANQSPEQLQASLARWNEWIGGIAAQDKLGNTDALGLEGRVIKADGSITDGPYVALKEMIGGYTIVKAENMEEALKLAEGCPMFETGGSVEIRDVRVFEQ